MCALSFQFSVCVWGGGVMPILQKRKPGAERLTRPRPHLLGRPGTGI